MCYSTFHNAVGTQPFTGLSSDLHKKLIGVPVPQLATSIPMLGNRKILEPILIPIPAILDILIPFVSINIGIFIDSNSFPIK